MEGWLGSFGKNDFFFCRYKSGFFEGEGGRVDTTSRGEKKARRRDEIQLL